MKATAEQPAGLRSVGVPAGPGIAAAALACFLAVIQVTAAARASSLQVAPTLVEFEPRQQTAALWLRNPGTTPIQVQVRVEGWEQDAGTNRFSATRDVVPSPAMLQIAPGARRMVRLIRMQPAPLPQERSYRLRIDEVPAQASASRNAGVRVVVKFAMPMFVKPVTAGVADAGREAPEATRPPRRPPTDLGNLHLSLSDDGAGSRLHARNDGGRRIKIADLVRVDGDGREQMITAGLVGYVLAGRSVSWPLKQPYPLKPGQTLEARIDDAPDTQPLPMDGARR